MENWLVDLLVLRIGESGSLGTTVVLPRTWQAILVTSGGVSPSKAGRNAAPT